MEERIDRWEERDRKMDEVFEKVVGWENEKMSLGSKGLAEVGVGEEWRSRVRRMEIKQDEKEREERRNNVVREIGVEGKAVQEEVRKLWERMGVEDDGINEVVRIGRTGREGGGMVLVNLGEGRKSGRSSRVYEDVGGREGKKVG